MSSAKWIIFLAIIGCLLAIPSSAESTETDDLSSSVPDISSYEAPLPEAHDNVGARRTRQFGFGLYPGFYGGYPGFGGFGGYGGYPGFYGGYPGFGGFGGYGGYGGYPGFYRRRFGFFG